MKGAMAAVTRAVGIKSSVATQMPAAATGKNDAIQAQRTL